MKLREWAEQQGVSWRTAYRRFKDGKIPGAYQAPNGHIHVKVEPDVCDGACVAELHVECLIEKLTATDVEQLVQRLAESGYVIERRTPT